MGPCSRYLLHDRDSIYGDSFRARVRGMGMEEALTAPRSPQNPYAERLAGSTRRECLDHIVIFNHRYLGKWPNEKYEFPPAVSFPWRNRVLVSTAIAKSWCFINALLYSPVSH